MRTRDVLTILLAAAIIPASLLALPQAAAPAADRTIEASASIKPAAPKTGENVFEVRFMEASKPVTGLKLTSNVGMTSMDMGTAHPLVKETSPGHYTLRPMFQMDGPWRITLVSKAPKFTVSFDMTVGGDKPWQLAKKTIKITGSRPAGPSPPKKVLSAQPEAPKAEPAKPEPPKQLPPKQEPPRAQPTYGQDMSAMGHVAASLPQLKEKASYAWTGNEDWETRTGFGKLEPMVRMMLLMMVGGSGMEGMKMAPMDMVFSDANFTEEGVKPEADAPDVGSKALKVEAKLDKASVGDNNISIIITTPGGAPVTGVRFVASVSMTSMDMGTSHPAVQEIGKGKYAVKATFTMIGPWRLSLVVTATNMPPSTYTFDFEAK
ncbi:MAG: FixH family protein [Fimbriimonas ginsengisoli]|uniref:FixH family protein n=1 Tax=Fimbriimonas ginsengisoli TaxID=1005039 RepID=A0A931PUE0_FIMGI|nr:FixH family protein [Fimbriimonas ginsengisoli]